MQSKRLRWFGLGLAVVAAIAGGGAYRYVHRYKHFAIHEPGLVYRSAWVEPDVFTELIEDYQIRTVLNLCEPGEMGEARWEGERQAVRGAGAQLLEMSLPRTVDAGDPVVEQFIQVLKNPDNYPILVHCQHGVTRTAKVLAMYDILFRGMPAEKSLRAMPLFGRDEYGPPVQAFAASFEKLHGREFPQMAQELKTLHR
jgi:protein-tyrosine phosphatase